MRPALVLALVLLPFPVLADVSGPVCVTDGATISVNGERKGQRCVGGSKVRLDGIDAPELKQTCRHPNGRDFLCGRYAASFLLDHVQKKVVVCKGDAYDKDGRLLGTCFVGGRNLNALMVREGWALAYRRYSKKYIPEEEAAKAGRKGMWMMKFMPPWEWRKDNSDTEN